MKTKLALLCVPLVLSGLLATARAQFNSGSDGSYGALNPTNSMTIQLPPNGILNCTTVTIPQNVSLTFAKNALNTPVYILATGDVNIAGAIYIQGQSGAANGLAGDGGPGGFAGGSGATLAGDGAGAGLGPGGGKAGTTTNGTGGAAGGSFGTVGSYNTATSTYGSRLLIPLIGGSGSGGCTTLAPGTTSYYYGGGGGGGAILIASSTKIIFSANAFIYAAGGTGYYTGGSGGAIRLVAPTVTGTSNNSVALNVSGSGGGGNGRTRIDALDHSNLNIGGIQSIGNVMVVFPNPLPKLNITNAAGTAIAEGSTNPVTVFLPSGSSANQQITVRARDFGGMVPIRVALIPETGDPTYTDATIDNATNNPADGAVSVTLPVNVQVHVEVYTR